MARHRKGKRMKAHYRSRSQRQVNAMYLWRHSGIDDGADNYGWLAPIPALERSQVIDLAIYSPQHWHLMAVVFCEAGDGKLYREFAEYRANQAIAARDIKTDEDQLVSTLRAVMAEAEKNVNTNHIIGRAVILRPWSRAYPSMQPVLERLRERFELTDDEVQWEAA